MDDHETGTHVDRETNEHLSSNGGLEAKLEDFAEKARGFGWNEKTAFDYERYAEATVDNVEYHANSAVFEWKDEYGDVAPELPALEEQLFGNEFKMRIGQHLDKLVFEVKVSAPENVHHVQEVRLMQNLVGQFETF